MIEQDPTGTMPHSLVLCMGSTEKALLAYDEVLPPEIKRVALIDTFEDEKFGAINAAELLGDKLFAVRLDTPASRRGNFYRILEEVRWELDLRGHRHVRIFVSGGIGEQDIPSLNRFVDAYGIGTSISNAPVIDYAMDIVEIDGKPIAKRGKLSGAKKVEVCRTCGARRMSPLTTPGMECCGQKAQDLLSPVFDAGRVLTAPEKPAEIRHRVLAQVQKLSL
jgi:nicotinate phosphoribosyltransferase